MKIRMKDNHTVTREVFETVRGWERANRMDGATVSYSPHHWEPVPDHTWVRYNPAVADGYYVFPGGIRLRVGAGMYSFEQKVAS